MARGFKKTRVYKKAAKYGKKIARDRLLFSQLPALYRQEAQQPVDERKVVFAEGKLNSMPDAYTLMWKWLNLRYDFDLSYFTLRQNSVGWAQYVKNCEDFVREIATAKVIFLNDASDVISCLPLRPETKVIQLWHACGAFKKWGMSTADLKFGGSRKSLERHPFYKNLDVVTVSSPEVAWAYREAMVLEDTPDVVQPFGVSRTDVFFDPSFVYAARSKVDMRYPGCRGKKLILYAPTFRGRVKKAKGPDALDIAAMHERLGQDYVLLVKHHPFVKKPPAIPPGCESFAYMVGNTLPIDVLLAASDVCITDYSSVVFEYSLFVRPLAFFAPDLDDYGDWRGFYYDFDELTPGPVFTENEDLLDWLAHVDERFDAEEVRAFRHKFMRSCDGNCTQRIARFAFGDELLERHERPNAVEELASADPQGIDVSIVIPAYNSAVSLKRALSSVIEQTYDLARMEVIVVDDCSTDGTADVARDYQEAFPDLIRVASTDAQSGSPSAPRNIGIGMARGTYVFFLDADDWLGPKAVMKMLKHAVKWNSDVLAVKMCGWGGRAVPRAMFERNRRSCNIYRSKLMWTFSPLKLFRRTLIEDLRFPDFMPEDISFVLRAFVKADVVSIAADYEYYNVAYAQGEGENISLTSWDDIESNLRAYEDLFGFIQENVPEEERDHVLMRRLMRRDILRTFVSIARMGEDGREYYDRLVQLAGPYYVPEVYETTPIEKRVVLDAAFVWGFEALCEVVGNLQRNGQDAYAFLSYELEDDKIVCTAHAGDDDHDCEMSAGLRSKAVVDYNEWIDESTLVLSGTLGGSQLLMAESDRFEATLIARHEGTDEERSWPCTVEWLEAAGTVEDDYPAKGAWAAAIDAADVFPEWLEDEWFSEPEEQVDGDAPEEGAELAEQAEGAEERAEGAEPEQAADLEEDAADAEPEGVADGDEPAEGADGGEASAETSEPACEQPVEDPASREDIWDLYLTLEAGALRKNARLRFEVVSLEIPRRRPATDVPWRPGRQWLLCDEYLGKVMLVERSKPEN